MSVTAKLKSTFTPADIYFLAEDEQITIIPRQVMDSLDLIGISTPKLSARRRAKVPLWLALILKKQSRCNIVTPEWLDEDHLRKIYDDEMQQEGFASLPWHWLEIALVLLEHASDDLPSASNIRNLVQDIREVRQAKTRAGLALLDEWHIQMDNLGLLEMNAVRPFMIMTMDRLRRIKSLVAEDEESHEFDEDLQVEDDEI